jgi:hypothetical protein
MTVKKVDIMAMGVSAESLRRLVYELNHIDNVSLDCTTYDLFKPVDMIRARMSIATGRADMVVFYWDISGRPVKLILDIVFPLYGHLGLQYEMLSRVRAPLIVLPHQATGYFLHADLVAFCRLKQKNACLAESIADLKERIRLICHPPVWGGKKVCIFGRPFKSSTIRPFHLTEKIVSRRTGVEVQYRSLKALAAGAAAIDEQRARVAADRWMQEATSINGATDRDILASSRMSLFLDDLVTSHGFDGISVSCVGKSFPWHPEMAFPCLAFSRLRDRGIAAVCEADICALLTAMLMESLAGKPSYMGNVVSVDRRAGRLTLTHCVTGLGMRGDDFPPMDYSLQDYHGTGHGAVPAVAFPINQPVTLGLLSKDLLHFVLWPGTIVETGQDFCANMARVQIPDPDGFKQSITGCHYVMVYGDIVPYVHDVLMKLNITSVGPLQDSTELLNQRGL